MSGVNQPAETYYDLLGIKPTASPQQIRRAYRDLSKLYHPDTTTLSPIVATERFQKLNEAYATLSSPDRRLTYDQQVGYSRISVIQAPSNLNRPSTQSTYKSSSAYLDPTDRPLSAGEIFALFILGVTFVACLALVITVGIARGDMAFNPSQLSQPVDEVPVPFSQENTESTREAVAPPQWL
ncbi:molecular chaperone DnaJ [filamentous cyanobacterium CCP5]|nr:molecular chaperone DnaJ [filamentous cyanobacterium CCP5]